MAGGRDRDVRRRAIAAAKSPPGTTGSTGIWGDFAANAFLEDPRVPSVDFRRSPGLDDLLAVAAETEPRVDALRDDYLANVGDAARQTADAIAALATPPGPAGVGRARPV